MATSATSAPASTSSSSSSSSSGHGSKRVGQVKANSKLNLISPRSFKFPGEKLLKKIGSASISKEKENTLTLSTSVATRRGRPKRHHSLDDLDDSMRRNVSFGRKGNKARDAIASDSEEDKASLWDGSYGDDDDTSSSHSSDTDSDDWRDPTWVLDEWEEEERRLWREKKQREKEELERREREVAGLPPLPPSADSAAAVTLTSTESSSENASSENLSTMASGTKSTSTPTSPTPASKAASHQRRNSRVEIIVATDPLKQPKNESESDSDRVRSSSREWPLRRARSFSETGEAGRVVKSKLDPGMKKRSLSSHSLPSSVDKQQQQQLKRRVSHDDAVNDDGSDNDNNSKSASSKRERKRKNSIKRKSGSGILSTFAGIKHLSTDGTSNEGSGFLQSVKRRGRSLSGKGKGVDKERVVVDKERVDRDRDKEQVGGGGDGVRSPTTQKLSRSDEKVRSQTAGQAAAGGFDLDELRSPRHSVCVTRPTATATSPAHAHSHAHAYSTGASPSTKTPPTATKLFPKRERASSSSAPYVPRLKLPSHAPAMPKSYFSAGSSSSASLSPVPSPLTSPATVSKSTTSLPYLHSGGGDATVSSLPSSPRSGFLNTTPASSPSSPYLHMPHRTPPLSPKGDKFSSKSGSRQGKHRSSSLSGASGSEGEAERLTWSNVWQSTTIEREMEIEAEVELEMEIEERARSDELELPGLGLGTSWQPIALQQRTDSRERVGHREREKVSTSTTATATTPSEVKKRSDRHSGGAVATTASSAGLEMRSPEVLRWSGEMSRRSYRRSSLTGSQPAPPGVSAKPDAREEALAAREEALREHEEKVRQERDEFERERSEWAHEREKLLLELKRMRILQQEGLAGTTPIGVMAPAPNDRLLWSPQHDLSTVVGNNAAAARQKSEEKAKAKTKAEVEKNEDEEGEGENEEEEETAVVCAHCREKEETIRKLERDLKRIKYLYYEANGKLMESTMRDKNRDRHQLGSSSGGSGSASLHRSDSAESGSGMATPRSRQLKETASLIFHESSSKSKHRKSSERAHTPRGSPVSPRSADPSKS